MGKKKGGGKKKKGGGGRGGSTSNRTMAVGGSLATPSSFHLWKLRPAPSDTLVPPVLPGPRYEPPVQHRSAPTLSKRRRAPAGPSKLLSEKKHVIPLSVVKAATAGVLAPVRLWIDKGLEEGGAAAAMKPRDAVLAEQADDADGGEKLSDEGVPRTEFRWDSPSGLLLEYTLLMICSKVGHHHLVELLLDRGADVDAVDARGHTALIIASQHGHRTIVQRLLSAGCRTDVRAKLWLGRPDTSHGTAAEFATSRHFPLLARLIETHEHARSRGRGPPRLAPELVDACTAGDHGAVTAYLECGGHVDAIYAYEDKGMYTLLMLAAERGHAKLVTTLLRYGADTAILTRGDGSTALMLAASAGHQAVVRELLRPKPPRWGSLS